MGPIGWLLQWPVRALVLLLVVAMPLGVELSSFSTALGSAALIGLLGILLIVPLKMVLALPAVGCGQPGWIAGAGELAVQLDDHGDLVQLGGGVD